MATEVVMPRLSDTMETGTIAKWLKNVGDQVVKGETIAEIETDKANMEMESYAAGILAKITVGEGQSAGVGEPIAVIAADASEAETLQSGPQPEAPQQTDRDEPDQIPPDQGPPAQPQIGKTEPNERIKASPLARRLAQEHDIDLMDVGGTGPGGRITKEDVLSFLKQTAPVGQAAQQQAPAPAPTQQEAPPRRQEQPQPSGGRGGHPVEMTRMQRTIARRMTEARFSKPDFVLTVDIDMTAARQLLQNIAGTANAPKVGPNDLLIKAAALALVRHPKVNAGWETDTMVRYGQVNVGFAVALEDGLVVPVVRDADQKSLGEIARDAKELIDKARSGKLAPSDYEDGTFTISNLGMYGIEQFTPIINPPEACIMGVGAIEQRPVVVDGQVTVRDRMRVSLACDHRVIDGAQGAQFLQTFVGLLENPMLTVL